MAYEWPQYTMIAMYGIGVGLDLARHGRPKKDTHNVFCDAVWCRHFHLPAPLRRLLLINPAALNLPGAVKQFGRPLHETQRYQGSIL